MHCCLYLSDRSSVERGFIQPISCSAGSPRSISPPDKLGAEGSGVVSCFSISPPYNHIVSLVSRSSCRELSSALKLVEGLELLDSPVGPLPISGSRPSQPSLLHLPSFAHHLSACQVHVSCLHPHRCLALARPHHVDPPTHPLLCLCLARHTVEVSHFFRASLG